MLGRWVFSWMWSLVIESCHLCYSLVYLEIKKWNNNRIFRGMSLSTYALLPVVFPRVAKWVLQVWKWIIFFTVGEGVRFVYEKESEIFGLGPAGSNPTELLSNPIGMLGLFGPRLNAWADPIGLFRICFNPIIKSAYFKFWIGDNSTIHVMNWFNSLDQALKKGIKIPLDWSNFSKSDNAKCDPPKIWPFAPVSEVNQDLEDIKKKITNPQTLPNYAQKSNQK